MSSNYSANQYQSAFRSQTLQNWCEAKRSNERPAATRGRTTFIVDDRGHLLRPRAKRDRSWSDFKGTWDLPVRIPAHSINATGRSAGGLNRLKSWGFDPRGTKVIKDTDRLLEAGNQNNDNAQKDAAAEDHVDSQRLSGTEGVQTASKDQDSQPAAVGSVDPPAK
ncbi:protein Flattop [Brachionichthys hirsutus]|uniref:protein Flattop n=1 Tax=Brachionichthys hirsutus TaxID=412623 RepID=UPI003604BB03